MIVDIHAHLGDILHPGGGKVADARLRMAHPFDPDALLRLGLYGNTGLNEVFHKNKAINGLMSRAERMRNYTATVYNLAAQMDRHGVAVTAVMPIAPNTLFEDVLRASARDARVLPFGSFDFTQGDLAGQAKAQLAAGARGFKLHPILQRVSPDSPEVAEALAPLPDGTVVLLHTGEAVYYPGNEMHLQRTEYGRIEGIAALFRAFPHLRFVAAHGGLRQFREFMELLPGLPHVFADTTFCSPSQIRVMLDAFGPGRVLFGSDWPYGHHGTSLQCVRVACRDKAELEAVLGGNAAKLLNL